MTQRRPFFRPRLAFSANPRPAARPLADETSARFAEVMLPHLDAAYNYARFLTRDATLAEDIVQDAFLRAFRGFAGFRGGSPKAWLLAIVRNGFLDSVAAHRRGDEVLVEEGALTAPQADALTNIADPDQDTPETALSRRREAEGVRAAIEALPEPFREALILRELDELSYREIAALTGAPMGTVMSRLARARQILATTLLPGDADAVPVRIGTSP